MTRENGEGQWYTNRDLFEQLNDMRGQFHGLSAEMKETRAMIRQYNGLRGKIEDVEWAMVEVEKKIDSIENRAQGRTSVGTAIREWGGWLVALAALIISFI